MIQEDLLLEQIFHELRAIHQLLVRIAIELAPRPAASARLTLGGPAMPGSITVDTTNETVTVGFLDDHGDAATAPEAVVVTFTSDNEAVLTVAPDASNPLQGDITPIAEGTANVSASLANADGSPLLEADGVTAFPEPSPVQVTVSAGPAASADLILSV